MKADPIIKKPSFRLSGFWLAAGAVVLATFCPVSVWADVTVTPEQLGDEVKAFIAQNTPLQDPEATLQVETVRLPQAPILMKGQTLKVMMTDPRNGPLTLRTIVQVTLSTEAETRHIGVPIRIAVEKPVWVVTRFVRAKEPLSAQNVTIQRKQLMYDAPYTLSVQETLQNYSSRINMTPGTVLDLRNLHTVPLVYRNADVYILMDMDNGVSVRIPAKAMEDGALGKRIRVCQRLANNKPRYYMAEVVNQNTVRVKM